MNIDRGLVNVVVFLDSIKAFDTADHDIFFRKLPHYRIHRFAYYLGNGTQICHMDIYLGSVLRFDFNSTSTKL